MAKVLKDILASVIGTEGSADYENKRDRYLHAFQAPITLPRDNWTSYYSSQIDDPTRQIWKVPTGVSIAKFELWGAGGGGAGSVCCQQGPSGGSGAYAYKEISVTPGDRYVLCLGDYSEYCCTMRCAGASMAQGCLNKQLGYKGPTAYVLGNGLSNFCAEGGNPGVSAFCPAYHLHSRTPESEGRTCCCYCWTTCELFTGGPASQIRTLDSDNDVMRCACYFGADGGVRGDRGYFRISCCGISANANACGIRHGIPYPGGLWERNNRSAEGGHFEINFHFCCYCCGAPAMGGCVANMFFNGAAWNNWAMSTRGVGGITPAVSDGQQCCGGRGGPSAIFISYC